MYGGRVNYLGMFFSVFGVPTARDVDFDSNSLHLLDEMGETKGGTNRAG